MKTKLSILGLFLVALCAGLSLPASGSDLEITGFFDVTGSYQNSAEDKTAFGLGQAELDLEHQLANNVLASVGIAYNNETSNFELAMATVEINLINNNRSFINSASISAGQFYVPFGIDYNVRASIDRKLITSPLAVGLTHAGWNDLGVQFNVESEYGNLVIYGVNGFESSYEVSDQAHSLSLGLAIGEEINTTPANAFGGRLALTPIENLEIGGSAAMGLNKSDKNEMIITGGDLQYSISDFDFKGEYIQHSLNRSIEEEKNQGYYFQSTFNLNQVFLVGRYGAFKPDGETIWTDRTSIGAGYIITDGVELRFESTIYKNSNNNTNILQLAAGF